MKMRLFMIAVAPAVLSLGVAVAQAPAGSTGQCRDGSYTNAADRSGACRGHKGIQTWYAASASPAPQATPTQSPNPAAQPPAAVAPAPAAMLSPAATPSIPSGRKSPAQTAASRTQAPGAGPGMVWVNTSTKVYHCMGTEFYGKTKDGKYMSEADAKNMGDRPDHNNPCTK